MILRNPVMNNKPLNLGIAGIRGRLGSLCKTLAIASPDFSLKGGTSRENDPGKGLFSDPLILAQQCDVIIDVSHASLTQAHAEAFTKANVAWVNGVTGLNSEQQALLGQTALKIPVLQASNFSPALTLFFKAAEMLAKELPDYDAEIIETHHNQKADAPSGTALSIGRAVAKGRNIAFSSPQQQLRNKVRTKGEIGFSSIRGGRVVGEHELRFLGEMEEITLSHRSFDRKLFASGALKAAYWLGQRRPSPNRIYDMEDLIES
ncbi:4-hydroxy-tetrahydrodipicolinate reductase [Acetobacteraceae bacterium]|nr:4-hydroxy-tetrahydrodipicolinate reductase [Acetobacteraceae bacterium]